MKHLYIILLILPLIGFGQGFETTFGGEESDGGNSVQQTMDGGYIITGQTYSFGNGFVDVYLIKTDGSGNEQWSQTFGGTTNDVGHSVQQTNDGGYIITGQTYQDTGSNGKIFLIKTDENGNEEWSQTFDNYSIGFDVKQTNDGGYIITGHTDFSSIGVGDIYLIKTDGSGNEQWSQTFGAMDIDTSYSVQQTTDGGFIITGETYSFGGMGDDYCYLIKTDENGNEQWSQTFDNNSIGLDVKQANDGGYIITGSIAGSADTGYFVGDLYLIKTDENGEEQWSQTFGGTGVDVGYSVQQTTDGGYIITGWTTTSDFFGRDVYLIKTDGNGNEQWSQTFGGTGVDEGYSVQQTTDGGFIITGKTSSFGSGADVYLIKTNEWGNITSTIELSTPTSKRELIKTTNIIGQENTTIKNQPIIEIYDDGSVEKKYIVE
tara:strand:- start:108 stop:1403 length:1296 start_codon:yes stop_codon:yes gene_type:complete